MLKGNLTCTIVGKLLTHYVEDNLDKKYKEMVSIHLRNCPMCMEKYSVVKGFLTKQKKSGDSLRKEKLCMKKFLFILMARWINQE